MHDLAWSQRLSFATKREDRREERREEGGGEREMVRENL